MKNVVPFRTPDSFGRRGVDWTREPRTERERELREAYLLYESSAGTDGLMSVLLLSVVARRQGGVAADLQDAADHAEIWLSFKLSTHRDGALTTAEQFLAEGGRLCQ